MHKKNFFIIINKLRIIISLIIIVLYVSIFGAVKNAQTKQTKEMNILKMIQDTTIQTIDVLNDQIFIIEKKIKQTDSIKSWINQNFLRKK